jgi:sec-independent protein translocase protein TatB
VFGISSSDVVILVVVAAVVLGPERLPHYAQQLGRLVRELRRMAQGATEQVRAELGPEFDEVDWRKLDPRQYDPRRIVRDALSDTVDTDDPLGLKSWQNDLPAVRDGSLFEGRKGRHAISDSGTSTEGSTAAPAEGTGTRGGGPADDPSDPDTT